MSKYSTICKIAAYHRGT